MSLVETSHPDVDADRDPGLCAHGVLDRTVKGINAKVLLDPPEEELDLPAAFVDGRDGYGGQAELVGQKDDPLFGYSIDKARTLECFGIASFSFCGVQANGLSADERKVFDDTFQIERLRQELDFCPRGDRYLGLKLEYDKEINRLFLEESKDRKVLGKKLQLSTEVRIQESDYRWSRNENRALVYQEETTHYLFHQRPYGVFEAKLPLFNYLVLSGFEKPNKPKTVIKRIINQISPKTEEEREKVLSTAFDQIKEAMENGLLCCK